MLFQSSMWIHLVLKMNDSCLGFSAILFFFSLSRIFLICILVISFSILVCQTLIKVIILCPNSIFYCPFKCMCVCEPVDFKVSF